jgi:hypothetical protein
VVKIRNEKRMKYLQRGTRQNEVEYKDTRKLVKQAIKKKKKGKPWKMM